jgi:anti-sigma B factor antagonist
MRAKAPFLCVANFEDQLHHFRIPETVPSNPSCKMKAVMSLEITLREHEGIVILGLKGRITVGPEATALREAISNLTPDRQNVVLDLMHVDYIDSTGLGALVMCNTSLRKRGGAMKLLNLNRRNIELLVMTKLATVFEIFTDEQDAVNSFFPDRKIQRFDILNFVQQMKSEE